MNKSYLIIAIVTLFFIIAGFQIMNKSGKKQETQEPVSLGSATLVSGLESQTNYEGAVVVSVVPIKSIDDSWGFEIILDTHSVELNDDLTKTSILIADNKSYYPIAWDGDSPGGHHRSGILRFNFILPQPTSITIKILEVGGIKERNFIWRLK